MTGILHHSGTNPAEKKKIETEQEALRSYYALFENERKELLKALNEKDQVLNEKNQIINEKDKIIADLKRKLDEKK